MSPVMIFCKIKDITLDGEGNIFLILEKHKESTTIETVRKLREFTGKDVTIIVSEMI